MWEKMMRWDELEREGEKRGGERERERQKGRRESDTVSGLVGMQPNFTASRMSGTAYGCNLCDSLCVSPHINADIPSHIPYWSNIMSNTSFAWLHLQHNTCSMVVESRGEKKKTQAVPPHSLLHNFPPIYAQVTKAELWNNVPRWTQ